MYFQIFFVVTINFLSLKLDSKKFKIRNFSFKGCPLLFFFKSSHIEIRFNL